MERKTLRMPSPQGVAAGQTALVKLPIGNAFHNLYLIYKGVTLAQMTEIRIKCNSKIIHRYSAVDRDLMNQFAGYNAANGILTIPFDRQNLKARAAEEETLVNTGSRGEDGKAITSFEVEIDISSNATSPAVEISAEVSDARPGGIGTMLHVTPYVRANAGAGEFQVSDLPKDGITRIYLNRIFMKAAKMTKLKIERNQYVIFERTKALNELIQKDGVRVPQADWFVFDATEVGYGGAMVALAGSSDFRLTADMSGAENVTFYPEYIGQLGD